MRILFSILAMFTAFLTAGAQNAVDILTKMPPSRIVFNERVFNKSGVETGSKTGSAEVQYPCFSVSYGTIIICGDGKTVWYRDTADDEVTISGGSALDAMFSDKSIRFDAKNKTVTVGTPDGGHRDFRIVFVEEFESKWPESHFRMEPSTFGPNTIVTDLR